MPLWGDKEVTGSNSGTIDIATNGAVTGTGTAFTTELAVGNYIRVASIEYRVTAITDNTNATVLAGTINGAITAQSGASYTISNKPISISYTDNTINANQVFFVDTTEAADANNTPKGLDTAGWVRYETRTTSDGAVRHYPEVMVAMKRTTAQAGDAEDTVVED